MSRIEWREERFAEVGFVGGFRLFSVVWGTRSDPELRWSLSTDLPIRSEKLLGQVHASKEDAKAAAERLMTAFTDRITTTAPNPSPPAPCTSEAVEHHLIGNVCTCGDWSAGCGYNVPEQWRQHVNATAPDPGAGEPAAAERSER